jgi:hypothetical protein
VIAHHLLHELRIDSDYDLPFDPLASVFADRSADADGVADVTARFRLSSDAPAAIGDEWKPLFFHGATQVFGRDRDLLITDGASSLHVSDDGRSIDAVVRPASLEFPRRFTSITVLISMVAALRYRGLFHLHGAAVVSPNGRRVLIPGTGGAGKTTLALALVRAGWSYLSDDAVLLRDGSPAVIGLPREFHVAPATAAAMPEMAAHLGSTIEPGSSKRAVDAARLFPERRVEAMDAPEVVAFPAVEDRAESVLEPLAAADAMGLAIESSTLVAVDGMARREEHFAALRALVDGAECFAMRSGRDVLEAPEKVATLLELRT